MPTLSRVLVGMAGAGAVGGGVSTFYTSNSDPTAFYTAVRAFFVTAAASLASGSTLVFYGSGDTIDESSGEINGSWSMTKPANVLTSGSSNWAAGVGCRVVWSTSGITRGRRVKGSTFLVPLGGNLYDGLGSIADGTVTALQTAATTLAAADSGSMRIYTRPNAKLGTVGKANAVTGASVPDAVSWLRSRRV